MNEDAQCLRHYSEHGSQEAFRQVVDRYIGLVYSVALRRVGGERVLAEEVTQNVFTDLARQAGRLPADLVLGGWLHRHTCYVASRAVRSEVRRRVRERTAAEMTELNQSDAASWAWLAPELDDALSRLSQPDRDAIVLRFYQDLDLRAVGGVLGVSEDAAQKRVVRALEKLRVLLVRRGVALSLSAAALGTLLAAQSVSAAPPALVASVVSTSLAGAATAGTGWTTTFWETLLMTTKTKIVVAAVIVAAVVATPIVVVQHQRVGVRTETATKPPERIDLIVARHVLLWENRIATWEEIERVIPKLRDPAVNFRLWQTEGGRGQNGQLRPDVSAEMAKLKEKFGINAFTMMFLSPQASARYDVIREKEDLTPDESLRVSGTVVTPQGKPGAGAEVVLCAGTNDFFKIIVRLKRVEWRLEQIVTDTDESGRFSVFPPRDTPYMLLVLHADGFALADSREFSPQHPILLQPWNELQVTLETDSRVEEYVNLVFNLVLPAGAPHLTLEYRGGRVDLFAVPSPGTAFVQRRVMMPEVGSSVCLPGKTVAMIQGEAQTVTLEPITEAELAEVERREEEIRQEQPR